jgi:hypothetical protein
MESKSKANKGKKCPLSDFKADGKSQMSFSLSELWFDPAQFRIITTT